MDGTWVLRRGYLCCGFQCTYSVTAVRYRSGKKDRTQGKGKERTGKEEAEAASRDWDDSLKKTADKTDGLVELGSIVDPLQYYLRYEHMKVLGRFD